MRGAIRVVLDSRTPDHPFTPRIEHSLSTLRRTPRVRFLIASVCVLPMLLLTHITTRLHAQAPTLVAAPADPEFESRAELAAQARAAEREGRRAEAWLLRSRLEQGDFQEGDRIVVTVGNNPPRTDTMQLRGGKLLQFAMADIPLHGVLRSELTDTLRHYLSKYIVNPVVRATPLLPLAVFGPVGMPGYHYFPADVLLRDVLMRVGGLGVADVRKTVIKRGTETIWDVEDIRIALREGLSLDRLHLRAGDEVYIPPPRRPRWGMILGGVSTALSLYFVFNRGGLY